MDITNVVMAIIGIVALLAIADTVRHQETNRDKRWDE